MRRALARTVERLGLWKPRVKPRAFFHCDHYLRHNARRHEHLATLGIDVAGKRVLELGAGIGDHSHYFLDRGCVMTITEVREDNLKFLRKHFAGQHILQLDMDDPQDLERRDYDVVYCYGLLYHLKDPLGALRWMSRHCGDLLLLSSCVSFGASEAENPVTEDAEDPTQAFSGTGCRPTRQWIWKRLAEEFAHVYMPRTQPNHEEFPLDWTKPEAHESPLSRAVFVASRRPIENPLLSSEILMQQVRGS